MLQKVVREIENIETDRKDRPLIDAWIADSGVLDVSEPIYVEADPASESS